ncbi:biotin--[acetyl-CoA-carboxylase] ligase [Tepidiforma flava]|uniref:biotin--[biotin carboxyl-carrier protein] ligase n=1 Tax=Tepidiforma flava TaxID=3004094 RepID=A0ABY7M6V3_9CHLR|nr:biotin--[acetyl-CoA-carboxylase] ligase [Tepidiforma flava]WBL36047.1 biotin--[acetyl-CoA-carboxylase] ligase [Tepidiforma flava]
MSDLPALDLARFQSLLHTRTVGRALVYRPVVGSTMDLARREAAEGAIHGTAVFTEEQTAGRGRRGRSFFSPAGANIYVTFVLRCSLDIHRTLPVRVPVAAAAAIRSIVPTAAIKWPNDVWVGDLKACGMLIDAELGEAGPVAFPGIGINVNFDPASAQPELRGIATSLAAAAGRPIDREALFARLCNELERALDAPLGEVMARYREWSMILGRDVTVSPVGGEPFGARAVDLDETGGLVVERPGGGRETVTAADVTVRPAAT